MKDYLFLFRADEKKLSDRSPEQMQTMSKQMIDWITSIDAAKKLVDRGNRLATTGKIVHSNNMITDGPFAEMKEAVGGYSVIKASSYDEAVAVAKGCPLLAFGGNVEVRELNPLAMSN